MVARDAMTSNCFFMLFSSHIYFWTNWASDILRAKPLFWKKNKWDFKRFSFVKWPFFWKNYHFYLFFWYFYNLFNVLSIFMETLTINIFCLKRIFIYIYSFLLWFSTFYLTGRRRKNVCGLMKQLTFFSSSVQL